MLKSTKIRWSRWNVPVVGPHNPAVVDSPEVGNPAAEGTLRHNCIHQQRSVIFIIIDASINSVRIGSPNVGRKLQRQPPLISVAKDKHTSGADTGVAVHSILGSTS